MLNLLKRARGSEATVPPQAEENKKPEEPRSPRSRSRSPTPFRPIDGPMSAAAAATTKPAESTTAKGVGLGKAKRHRKVLRDNIKGVTKPAIRRLARRGGVKRISNLIYEETRGVLKTFLEVTIRDAVTYMGMPVGLLFSCLTFKCRARPPQDGHCNGHCLRTQETRPHTLRLRRKLGQEVDTDRHSIVSRLEQICVFRCLLLFALLLAHVFEPQTFTSREIGVLLTRVLVPAVVVYMNP